MNNYTLSLIDQAGNNISANVYAWNKNSIVSSLEHTCVKGCNIRDYFPGYTGIVTVSMNDKVLGKIKI